ncbi:MAG: helix-turn-helix transcriptional regulator [Pasteurellaceae bacterium]|nr:helix-turn-helix transcriptional regulator [Pasteurellaceae bacterium]
MIEKDPDLELVSFDDVLADMMQNQQFAAEFNALQEQKRLTRMLKKARLEKQLTQAQVAELSGINVKNISRLERGITSPTFATLTRYAKALGGSFQFQFDPV